MKLRNFSDKEFSEYLRKIDRHFVYEKTYGKVPATIYKTRKESKFLALVVYDNAKCERDIYTD